MKIYTRRGDRGETGLFGGERVPKDDLRVAAYGTVDELNAVLGRAHRSVEEAAVRERMRRIQRDLFAIGAVLASPEPRKGGRVPALPDERIPEMEAWIDEAQERLEPLKHFVLPGGGAGGAELHVARTVCRRAERSVVAASREHPVDDGVVRYLNRLSDLLFVFARLENRAAGVDDPIWRPEGAGEESEMT